MMNEVKYDQLMGLSSVDYGAFCELRKFLIDDFICNREGDPSELQSLQREIDYIRASQCSPGKTIGEISELILLRVSAMKELSEKLISLQDSMSNSIHPS